MSESDTFLRTGLPLRAAAYLFLSLALGPASVRLNVMQGDVDHIGENGTHGTLAADASLVKKKFFTTTWISIAVFVVLWLVIHFGLVTLPALPRTY